MMLSNGKTGLLPRLAVNSIRRNSAVYLPYIGVCIFAIFTFFVYGMILNSDVTETLPRAGYATMLLLIGQVLLGLIMIPFLVYANSFLLKGRKKELGLYSILGMGKKHICRMMFYETILIFLMVLAGAIVLGLLFYRLLFLLLLNLAGLPVNITFQFSGAAFLETILFAGFVMLLQLAMNLYQVWKANPVDLMSESGKGERKLRFTGLWCLLGLLATGYGYWTALSAKLDSNIFTNFFVAVFCVVMGTHFLVTSGSIMLLNFLKQRHGFYYRSENFITISGMLYRMKKNAAGLANICIFSTMVIITAVCTVSLYLGLPGLIRYRYPGQIQAQFLDRGENSFRERDLFREEAEALAGQTGVRISDYRGGFLGEEGTAPGEERNLSGEEGTVPGEEGTVSREGENVPGEKADLPGEEGIASGESEVVEPRVYLIEVNPEGDEEAVKEFSGQLQQLFSAGEGFLSYMDYGEAILEDKSMYGGLLFVGITFGMIFLICLLIIMYYKQIAEGFEDRRNFDVFKKVGMDEAEVQETIKRQIRLVFYLPLTGAFLHTLAGMHMVIVLLGSIHLYDQGIMIGAAAVICVLYAFVYVFCYRRTAKAYYRIVRHSGN